MTRQAFDIQAGNAESQPSQQQERFHTLVREVALWRTALAEWKERMVRFDQAVEPVRREVLAALREWVGVLDAASLQPGLARGEREQLSDMLRASATALLEAGDFDAQVAPLLARHGPETARGAASGDRDPPPEAESAADWEALAQAAAAQREQRAAARRSATVHKRRAAAAREVSQSVRDMYRKLASALHPDREPDARARQRKTTLMQAANQAHADGNLLALLELQVEAEQLDATRPAALDGQRLKNYVTVLEEQLAQLQAETRGLEASFREAVGAAPGSGLRAAKADRLVSSETQRLRSELLLLRRQCRMALDVESLKGWLREQRKAGG
ncbi:hypothetical protein WG902_03340 [Ramlibacter sp. PS3R-8]|uniref:hypothetical protein n=1 Tax=Ramlibacter sp. PS3R-8 TaxID=3133437 RepID=UPI0030AA1AC9